MRAERPLKESREGCLVSRRTGDSGDGGVRAREMYLSNGFPSPEVGRITWE